MPALYVNAPRSSFTLRSRISAFERAPEIGMALLLVSLWPIAAWIARRARDGSDEPWGLVALAALLVVTALSRKHAARQQSWSAVIVTLAYGLSLRWLSPLPNATLGLLALALCLSRYLYGRTLSLGTLGLCWLSLPLFASLDFYLGYPLRLIAAEATTWLLHCSGFAVQRSGVNLIVAGAEIAVDPACSGIRMLWGTALLISLLDCVRPLPFWNSLAKAAVLTTLLLFGNAWRVAALFYLESGRIQAPFWFHDATGVAVFIVTLALAVMLWQHATPQQAGLAKSAAPRAGSACALCAAAGVALLAPVIFVQPTTSKEPPGRQVAWPLEFEHRALVAQMPPPSVERFYRSFPGKVGFFRTQAQQLILRRVNEPTRMLHPAEQCYRANGYEVKPARQCVRADGERYGCFIATLGDRSVRVSERINDDHGNTFTDVSSWYWSAMFGRSKGPWHSVTIAEGVAVGGTAGNAF